MAIATVLSITGRAWARDEEGNVRELSVGDTLLEGEVLVTSDNGSAQLDFGDGLDPTLVEGGDQIAMTPELDADEPLDGSEFAALDDDLEALLTAIDEGEGDLLDMLEAPAAGPGAGGGGGAEGGGHNFVRLARIAEEVNPLAFEYGLGQISTFDFPEGTPTPEEGEAVLEPEPIIPDVAVSFMLDSANNELTASLTGTSTNAATITVVLTGGGLSETFTVTPDADGSWSVDLSGIDFEDGVEYSVDVTATSSDGNTATAEANDSYTLPTVEITEFDVSSTDNTVSSELTGTADNATSVDVTVTGPNGEVFSGNVPVDADGNWTVNLGTELPEGEYSVSVTARDDSNNTSDPASDTSGYTLPTVEITEFDVSSTDNTVSSELTGTASNATSVDVTVTGPNGEVFSGNVPVDADGNWSVDLGTDLPEGDYSVSVTARDGSDNTSDPASAESGYTLPAVGDENGEGGSVTLALSDAETVDGSHEVSQTLSFTAGSDAITAFAFGDTDGITVDGLNGTLTWATDGDGSLMGSLNGTEVLKLSLSGTDPIAAQQSGNITVTAELLSALPHDNDTDDLSISGVSVIAADQDGNSATGDVAVGVVDDGPVAEDDEVDQTEENAPVLIDVFDNDEGGADGVDLVNDVAVVADSLSGDGELVYNGDGTFTYTPAAGEEGTVTFDYSITDGDGDSATATVTITLLEDSVPEIEIGGPDVDDGEASVNEAGLPEGTANDGSHVTSGTFAIDTGNDELATLVIGTTDVTDGGTVTGEHGTLVVTRDGDGNYTWTYTLDGPTDGDDTQDVFTLVATDDDGSESDSTLTIGIVDDEPVAVDDSTTTDEDTAVTYNVLANDIQGADGATLTTASLAAGYEDAGIVSINAATGEVTFTPAPGFEGAAVIDYTITDADGDDSSATLTVTVGADSVPEIEIGGPDVDDGEASVNEAGLPEGTANDGSHVTSGTFAIDTGNDELATLVIGTTDVTDGGTVTGEHGTLVVTRDGDGNYTWTYTLDGPTDGDDTQDVFTLVATDDDGSESDSTLTIGIVDDEPVAVDDSTTTDEDTAVTYNVLANDIQGADGATLTTASLAAGYEDAGIVSINAATGEVTFTPAPGFEGAAVIDYTITDADGDDSSATLTVTVGADSVPEIEIGGPDVDDGEASVNEAGLPEGTANDGSHVTSGTFAIDTGNDELATLVIGTTDVTDGGTVTGEHGTLVVTRDGDGNYTWTYTLDGPTDGDDTQDVFTLVATDDDGSESDSTLTIGIVDDEPVAVDDSIMTDEDTAVTYNVLANDIQGADGATLTTASLAAGYEDAGIVSINAATGEVTFTPAPGFEGAAVIDYTITDADGDDSS